MLKHVVFLKFKKDAAETDIAELEKGLAGLPQAIAEIRESQFGRDIVRSERSYDLALISAFDDQESLQRYRVHPAHKAVQQMIKQIADGVAVVDFKF